jgi:type II secretory pathway component PulC
VAKRTFKSPEAKQLLSFHVGDRVIFRALSLVPVRYKNLSDGETYAIIPSVGEQKMYPKEREYMASTYAKVMEVKKHTVVIEWEVGKQRMEVAKKLLGIHREQLKLFV